MPGHLLRMIPAEYSERSLTGSLASLDAEAWYALGHRLFDDDTLRRLRSAGDRPLCRVRLFGGLDVSVGDRAIRERDWRKRKARLLFAMLVTRRGQDVPRDQVLEHLWPDMDEDRARNNLYVAWSTMKSVLGGEGSAGEKSPYVENAHGVCRTVRDTVRSDIDEFEEALTRARDGRGRLGTSARALEAYEQVAVTCIAATCCQATSTTTGSPASATTIGRVRRRDAAGGDASAIDADDGLAMRSSFARRAIQVDQLREDLYQMHAALPDAGRPAQLRHRHVLPLPRQARRGAWAWTPRLRRVRSTTRYSRWRTGPCPSRSTRSRSRRRAYLCRVIAAGKVLVRPSRYAALASARLSRQCEACRAPGEPGVASGGTAH